MLQLSHIQEAVSDSGDASNSNKSDFLKYYLPQLDDSPDSRPDLNLNSIYADNQLKDNVLSLYNKEPVSPVSGKEGSWQR